MVLQPVLHFRAASGFVEVNAIGHTCADALALKGFSCERQAVERRRQDGEKRLDFVGVFLDEDFLKDQLCERVVIC